MSAQKINQTKFKAALKGTAGVQSDIAAKIGCSRMAVTYFLDKYPKMRELVNQERQKLIDVAENVYKEALSLQTKDTKEKRLNPQVKRDNMKLKLKAAEKVVSTLGKTRGWIPREERDHSGEVAHNFAPVKINVIMPKENVHETKTPIPNPKTPGILNDVKKKEAQAPRPKPQEGEQQKEKKGSQTEAPPEET